jgi:serine/threonine protein phosphatase PrpC
LIRDHKADLPDEKARILLKGGSVGQYMEGGLGSGPYRVWMKNEMYPGLAMSRSIGDSIATGIGVISTPEVMEMSLSSKHKFIILASDGIWEFLDNKTVMNMVIPFYEKNDPSGACAKLVEEATNWWKKEDEVIDDITVVIIFL